MTDYERTSLIRFLDRLERRQAEELAADGMEGWCDDATDDNHACDPRVMRGFAGHDSSRKV